MQAEYTHQTGAKHLRERVSELEGQLKKATAKCEEWQQAFEALNKEHTAVLVAAKEHEVRSQYGRQDRATLDELRVKLETLLREKGHGEGVREALAWMAATMQREIDLSDMAILSPPASQPKVQPQRNGKADAPALPCRS
jgi:hypothetical protein